MVYLGSAIFKIARLTFIALFFVHLFACIFYRIKETSANSPEDVVAFYTTRNIDADVSVFFAGDSLSVSWCALVSFLIRHISHELCICRYADALVFVIQDLPNQYVRTNRIVFSNSI